MEHIGQKIKDLRKKADLTQDRLADYLGVTAQAVSKWEVGQTAPDLSLIAPLCRVLGCSADELLGIAEDDEVAKARESELLRLISGNDFDPASLYADDRLEKCLAAVEEFPRNLWMHYYCAMTEAALDGGDGSEASRAHWEAAEKRYRFLLEEATDDRLRACVINNLVTRLAAKGRKEEAAALAGTCPDLPNSKISKDYLLLYCLEGEQRRRHWQTFLRGKLGGLLTALRLAGGGEDTVRACEAAVAVVDIFFPDGNLLDLNNTLCTALEKLIGAYAGRKERADDLMRVTKRYCEVCAEIDRINALPPGETVPFTAPLFDLVGCAPPIQMRPAPLRDTAARLLRWPCFDDFCGREEYRALLDAFPLPEGGGAVFGGPGPFIRGN